MATDSFKGDGASWHIENVEYTYVTSDVATVMPTERGQQDSHVTVACPLCGAMVKRTYRAYHYRWVGHYVSIALREHLEECPEVSRKRAWGADSRIRPNDDPLGTLYVGKGPAAQTVLIRRDHDGRQYEVVVI